jgi:hypothetical protein
MMINLKNLRDECQEELKDESFPVTDANLEVYKKKSISLQLLHQRLGHFNLDGLETMERQGMLDMTITGNKAARKMKCDVCSRVKATKNHPPDRRESAEKSKLPFEYIYSDVKGPLKPDFWGNKYFVTFNDEFSRWSAVYFCKTKDEVKSRFKDFILWVEKKGYKIKVLTSDCGGEYLLEKVCDKYAIYHRFTSPDTPAQNGMSERVNLTFGNSAAALLYSAALDHRFWSQAIKHTVWIKNRLIHSSLHSKEESKFKPSATS